MLFPIYVIQHFAFAIVLLPGWKSSLKGNPRFDLPLKSEFYKYLLKIDSSERTPNALGGSAVVYNVGHLRYYLIQLS